MKALVIQGSPKKNGNTATLVRKVTEGFTEKEGNTVTEFMLSEMNIRPCQGCHKCQGNLEVNCVIQDDMQKIYPELLAADVYIWATPLYWWHMTGQMKLFLDRLYAVLAEGENTTNFNGKKLVFVVTYGVETPTGIELVLKMMEDIAQWAKMDYHLIRYHAVKPSVEAQEMLEQAYQLGKSLA